MVDSGTVQMKNEYKTIVTTISRLERGFMIRIWVTKDFTSAIRAGQPDDETYGKAIATNLGKT
ncbi:hypothetical protein CEK26_005767 [Fusarium fujikuroi]|uniref:Uncharacterized protein n=1 Tax=Fusarium fujikuroi TaxID=5127 RepID=A0A5Q3D5Q3_FUSFU|nr:Uncharacterized protein LW94_14562 [Fusarium fujikuroi]QGI61800.1 hypothetical protein CEK27_005771 [Fusarium fujikuroi]QGI78983.1 hypothetical protein CEK25_005712 [Fusarium fujikuroi]QGI92698.1 hypothetical protein CEK26_005767 [Fusarium fujikuroi]VTT65591.1 unnamed protein product [Fusarium fujikuroi]